MALYNVSTNALRTQVTSLSIAYPFSKGPLALIRMAAQFVSWLAYSLIVVS